MDRDGGFGLREALYRHCELELAQVAFRALRAGHPAHGIAAVCVQVDDPDWRPLADALMPGQDWAVNRALGQQPLAKGVMLADVVEQALAIVPSLDGLFRRPLELGRVRAAVLGAGGATVYLLVPRAAAAGDVC